MIRKFFGDGERDFALPAKMILELEAKTGAGIGELCRRLTSNSFRFLEVAETIRLAMIGAGTDPAEAHRLVGAYVEAEGTPLIRAQVLAAEILTNRMLGNEPAEGATEMASE